VNGMSICIVPEMNSGYVYFVKFGDLIKIGYAACVASRFTSHRRAQGEIEFLFSVKGSFKREQAFHKALKRYRSSPYGKAGPVLHEYFSIPEEKLIEIKNALSSEPGFSDKEIRTDIKQAFPIARETHKRLKVYAFKNGIHLQDIFAEAMNLWLEKHGEPAMYDSEGNEQ